MKYTFTDKIEAALKLKDCVTFIGPPLCGRTKFIRKIIKDLKIQKTSTFINLEIFLEYDYSPQLITDLLEQLKTFYDAGIRHFIFQYMPLDTEVSEDVYKALDTFRLSTFEKPSFVFLLNSSPLIYEEVFHSKRIFSNQLVTYNIHDKTNYDNAITTTLERVQLDKLKQNKENLYKLTGAIGYLLKVILLNNIDIEQPVKKLIENNYIKQALHQFFTELPDQDLNIINKAFNKKKLSEIETNYLKNIGLITDKDSLFPELVKQYIPIYSRSYKLLIRKESIYLNGKKSNEQFHPRTVKILVALNSNEILPRKNLLQLLSDDIIEYSEAAIDKAISRARIDLKQNGIDSKVIKTVKGKGYKLELDK